MNVLILRFSSIGDIVLTTPIIRSLKEAIPDCNIHYFTKPAFEPILKHNPYIDHIHLLEKPLGPQLKRLKELGFDHILDLHHNLRTLRIKWALNVPTHSFDKKNIAKYRMVRTHKTDPPIAHIVERYGATLDGLEVKLDQKGLDVFLPDGMEKWAKENVDKQKFGSDSLPLAVVLGANFKTKRWLVEHFVTTLNEFKKPVVLIGGPDALEEAAQLVDELSIPVWDAVGKFNLLESAAIMKQCHAVLAHDTGFMHIAAAFNMKVFSLWGSTVPEFGMTPYRTEHYLLENKSISCRPCSKLGHKDCPKGHFDCMALLSPNYVLEQLRRHF